MKVTTKTAAARAGLASLTDALDFNGRRMPGDPSMAVALTRLVALAVTTEVSLRHPLRRLLINRGQRISFSTSVHPVR
jgi:hypothetical protein